MSSAVVAMGTTVAVGTAAVYGLSALFAEFLFYRMIFFVAAVVLPIMAASWFIIGGKTFKINAAKKIAIERRAQTAARRRVRIILHTCII